MVCGVPFSRDLSPQALALAKKDEHAVAELEQQRALNVQLKAELAKMKATPVSF